MRKCICAGLCFTVSKCTGKNTYCGDFYVDINGTDNPPNTRGKGLFVFYITPDAIIPSGLPNDVLNRTFDNTCKRRDTTVHAYGYGCTAWVIYYGNMDYLHCDDLKWGSKTKCD